MALTLTANHDNPEGVAPRILTLIDGAAPPQNHAGGINHITTYNLTPIIEPFEFSRRATFGKVK